MWVWGAPVRYMSSFLLLRASVKRSCTSVDGFRNNKIKVRHGPSHVLAPGARSVSARTRGGA